MDTGYIYTLLERVSRTFALSIRLLKGPMRRQIALAYLLCRLLDTFEDDPALEPARKRRALDSVTTALEGGPVPDFTDIIAVLNAPEAEIELVRQTGALFAELSALPEDVRAPVFRWAAEMGRGMALAVTETSIRTLPDLERYCYYVAGTVGHMLTAVLLAGRRIRRRKRAVLESTAENFGRYLQFVNIIKDSGADYREGRCFLPMDMIEETGLSPDDFFNGKNRGKAAPVYARLLTRAADFARDSGRYVRALPRRAHSYRRFCILPLLLADRTLALCGSLGGEIAGLTESPKIGRHAVKRSYLASLPASFSNLLFNMVHREKFGWAGDMHSS